jgi:hypothetical protein
VLSSFSFSFCIRYDHTPHNCMLPFVFMFAPSSLLFSFVTLPWNNERASNYPCCRIVLKCLQPGFQEATRARLGAIARPSSATTSRYLRRALPSPLFQLYKCHIRIPRLPSRPILDVCQYTPHNIDDPPPFRLIRCRPECM